MNAVWASPSRHWHRRVLPLSISDRILAALALQPMTAKQLCRVLSACSSPVYQSLRAMRLLGLIRPAGILISMGAPATRFELTLRGRRSAAEVIE